MTRLCSLTTICRLGPFYLVGFIFGCFFAYIIHQQFPDSTGISNVDSFLSIATPPPVTLPPYVNPNPFVTQNTSVADVIANSVRILCMVLTTKNNHKRKASVVKDTWGQRCTKLVFVSDEDDVQLGAYAFYSQSGYKFLWGKVKAAYEYENFKLQI